MFPVKTIAGAPLTADEYDRQWALLDDFIRYNPGARHRRRWLLRALHKMQFDELLDIGCGNGALLLAIQRGLRRPNLKLSGVDMSGKVIEDNKQRLPDIDFTVLDIEKEALDRRFPVIVCSEVIEHLGNRDAAFRNLAAMLVKGGTLLLTCPAGRVYATEQYFGHTTHPALSEIMELASRHFLTVEDAGNWGFPTYRALKVVTNIKSEWALKNFASGRYSVPSKLISQTLYYANFINFSRSRFGCQFFFRLRAPD